MKAKESLLPFNITPQLSKKEMANSVDQNLTFTGPCFTSGQGPYISVLIWYDFSLLFCIQQPPKTALFVSEIGELNHDQVCSTQWSWAQVLLYGPDLFSRSIKGRLSGLEEEES